ncbi:MAG: AcvB/VirJ family lysyl-phosphatidylglycerol hydrolase, partial [Rhizobium sp.]|nr:AcvB/VirJ family lysyl-phosphatidylglycerol hydrolase [Rhizobium sp.]
MKSILKAFALVLALSTASVAGAQDAPPLDTGMIPAPLTLLPDDTPKALVVLLSDASGWQNDDQQQAERLQQNGAIVVGIDTPKYLESLSKDTGDCIYTVSDIEALG